MKRMLLLIYLLNLVVCLAEAKSVFTIAPYLNVEHEGKLTLNFRPSVDTELSIKISSQNPSIKTGTFTEYWPGSKLSKIDLGHLRCGEGLEYKIISKARLVVDHVLYSLPCEKEKPLYLGFMSDTQIKNEAGQFRANQLSKTIAELQKSHPVSLIINAGDIVQHGGRQSEWVNFFNTTNEFLRQSYLLSAVGNHEYFESSSLDKAPSEFRYFMRSESSPELGFLQLDLGRVNILILNSNFESITEIHIQKQWEWLEDKLKASDRPVIIVLHHSPYSSNLEHLRTIPSRLRAEFVPLIEKYKMVKIVLSGHLHMYERSSKAGITYLTAGPSGGINNVLSYKNPYSVFLKQFTTTFSILKMTDDTLEVKTFGGYKISFDEFSISMKE